MKFPQYDVEAEGILYIIYRHEDGHYSQVTIARIFEENKYEYSITL